MSKVQTLRVFVTQRLTAAAEEIFELFERTIAEYEEEVCRQRKLLDAVFRPEVQLHRADVQTLLASPEEDPPEQQDWSPGPDLVDQKPPQIKEEFWTSQEDDDEEPQSSQNELKETGGPEPSRKYKPDGPEDSFEPGDSDWKETRELGSIPVPDPGCETDQKRFSWSECGDRFDSRTRLDLHGRVHTGQKPLSCSVCGAGFCQEGDLINHMIHHTDGGSLEIQEYSASCSLWDKDLRSQQQVSRSSKEPRTSCSTHMEPGPEPGPENKFFHSRDSVDTSRPGPAWNRGGFRCSECGKTFSRRFCLQVHQRVHSGERPLSCSVCGKHFSQKNSLLEHTRRHTGQDMLTCPLCGKKFPFRYRLRGHMMSHTGERPFNCSECGRGFRFKAELVKHLKVHA